MLDFRVRYLQLAFNDDAATALRIVAALPRDERIIVEAGTPFIKREGMKGIQALRIAHAGHLVADLKTTDGGAEEVDVDHTPAKLLFLYTHLRHAPASLQQRDHQDVTGLDRIAAPDFTGVGVTDTWPEGGVTIDIMGDLRERLPGAHLIGVPAACT